MYTVPGVVGDWALDNIVIGNRSLHCPQLCNGRGQCTLDGVCVCDEGFSGVNCEIVVTSFPNFIQVFVKYMHLCHHVLCRKNLKNNLILTCGQ